MVRWILALLLLASILSALQGKVEAKKTADPYKVLGVDRSASQRDIQKAFHKLSLQYHPDKNKNKGAQEKFAEINNAYDILSDEDKKKNYDLYGDENGGTEFGSSNYGGGNFGGHEGYTYFTSGGPGSGQFRPEGWQSMGGQRNSFSFSFGGDHGAAGGSFGFGLNDIFSNFFGGQGNAGNTFGGFGGSAGPKPGSASRTNLQEVTLQTFKKDVADQGLTWILLTHIPSSKGYHAMESITEDVSNSLEGAIKAGSINCRSEEALCKNLGVWPLKSAKIFVYSYSTSKTGSLVEYTSDLDSRNLKKFCLDHLPRFSKRVSLSTFDFALHTVGELPQLLLLSTKKDTPAIWRAVSGLYHKRFVFLDAEALDVTDKTLKQLGVVALPAVVGRLTNGEVHVLKEGIAVNDLKTGINEMRSLLDKFEKKNKKATSNRGTKHSSTDTQDKGIPHLMPSNMDDLCGDKTVLCIIGIYRSSKAKDKLESILSLISQKTLIRRQASVQSSGDSIQYVLLDAEKQSGFLKSFDKSGFKNKDKILLAYKPRKEKFAPYTNEITLEEAERFIGSVLNGDIRFSKIQRRPVVK